MPGVLYTIKTPSKSLVAEPNWRCQQDNDFGLASPGDLCDKGQVLRWAESRAVHQQGGRPRIVEDTARESLLSGRQCATKVAILCSVPVPALIINTYASSADLSEQLPYHIRQATQRIVDTLAKVSFSPLGPDCSLTWCKIDLLPRWLTNTSPELFVSAAIAITVLLCLHRRLNEQHYCYDWIMAGSTGAAFVIGAWSQMSVLAIVLYLLPWSAYVGSVVSEMVCIAVD